MSRQQRRFAVMMAASALAFVAAGFSLVAHAGHDQSWLTPDFTTAVALAVAVQVWFVVASLKSMKA